MTKPIAIVAIMILVCGISCLEVDAQSEEVNQQQVKKVELTPAELQELLSCSPVFPDKPQGVTFLQVAEQKKTKDKEVPEYKLPSDPKTPVIVLNYVGGFTLPKISQEPTMSIYPDGKIVIPQKFQNTQAYEGQLTAEELQELLYEILDKHDYASYSQEAVNKKIQEAKDAAKAAGQPIFQIADAPTVKITVNANGKTIESSHYPSGINENDIEELKNRAAIQQRLSRVMSMVQMGGKEEVAKWLKEANKELANQFPDAKPLKMEHFTGGSNRPGNNMHIFFSRRSHDKDGKIDRNNFTNVMISKPVNGNLKITVTHKQQEGD